jgi:hypothetical protein
MHLKKSPFDFNSLMLYPPYAFAMVYDEYTMIKRDGNIYEGNSSEVLSLEDKNRIKALYGVKK